MYVVRIDPDGEARVALDRQPARPVLRRPAVRELLLDLEVGRLVLDRLQESPLAPLPQESGLSCRLGAGVRGCLVDEAKREETWKIPSWWTSYFAPTNGMK